MDRSVALGVLSVLGMKHNLDLRMATMCRGITGILHQTGKKLRL